LAACTIDSGGNNGNIDENNNNDTNENGNTDENQETKFTRFNGFTANGEGVYLIAVSNINEIFNFNDFVEVDNNSSWQLTADIQGSQIIFSRIVALTVGDNTFYVQVTADDNSVEVYTLQVRRLTIYTVRFLIRYNRNGVLTAPLYSPVVFLEDTQDVQEGSFAQMPQFQDNFIDGFPIIYNLDELDDSFINNLIFAMIGSRTGIYIMDIEGWDFDFSEPIMSNKDIALIIGIHPYSA
jgi:hypothetical protein